MKLTQLSSDDIHRQAAPQEEPPPIDRGDYASDPEINLFLHQFRRTYGDNLRLVILFGSCLSPLTRSPTSFPDFFVVVDNYRQTPGSWFVRLGHHIWPPDLYHLRLPGPEGSSLDCKYYLISTADLWQASGPQARDLYIIGRFSKQVAMLYARDQKAQDFFQQVLARATEQAARWSAALLESPLTEDEFYREMLRLSYRAEIRLEDERKIESLFQSGESYYREVYGAWVKKLLAEKILLQLPDHRLVRNHNSKGPSLDSARKLIAQSRTRAKLRWPKMILTVDNWLDQLLAKLERTYQIKLEIPPWERKIVLLTGWRHYFRLKRQGKIH